MNEEEQKFTLTEALNKVGPLPRVEKVANYNIISAQTGTGRALAQMTKGLYGRLMQDMGKGVISVDQDNSRTVHDTINGATVAVHYSGYAQVTVTADYIAGLFERIDELEKQIFDMEHEAEEDEY